jgi:hypothetical protein
LRQGLQAIYSHSKIDQSEDQFVEEQYSGTSLQVIAYRTNLLADGMAEHVERFGWQAPRIDELRLHGVLLALWVRYGESELRAQQI